MQNARRQSVEMLWGLDGSNQVVNVSSNASHNTPRSIN